MRLGLLGDVGGPGLQASSGPLATLGEAGAQGYESVWLQDEASGGVLSARLLLCAAQLGAREGAPGIGLCARAGDAIHPLRIAEELAVLDIMTAGRLEWAVAPDAVDWEVIEIVLRAWRGEPFAHAGEQHAIPETTCHPSPMADPHPTIWLANEVRVPDSLPLERHGRMVGMTTDQREAAESEARREHGRTPRAMARLLVIGERHAEARAIATEAVERMLDRSLRRDEEVSDFAIAGDGRACREQVAELREAHAPEVLVVVPSAQSAGEGQRRFAEEVIPNL